MKDVTLVAIDFMTYELTRRAIEITLRNFEPRDIVVISDKEFVPGARTILRAPVNGMPEYANLMLKGVAEYVETNHALYVQWDGIADTPALWTDEFLKYDYIGAPWPWQPEGVNIGNGGFSLRSKRLLDACATDSKISLTPNEPIAEDNIIGRHNRKHLEQVYGVTFPSTKLAKQFSYELGDPHNSFGFHGLWNVVYRLGDEDLDFFLERLDYSGWNIYKWTHFMQALVDRGSPWLPMALEKLTEKTPQFLPQIARVIK